MQKKLASFIAVIMIASIAPAMAQTMQMQDMAPATFAPTRQAYTTNHALLVKLLEVPSSIPYEKYFTLRFGVYDPSHPNVLLSTAQLQIYAGMRHGMKTGFAHGMQSSPKVADRNGTFTISGMYFHMNGPWTLKVTVSNGSKQGVAYFQLPCCSH
ncbi:MAG TPA: hypothetical protein VMA98_11965 [Candidatus Acidoferrales bacterium]|nr:hypothetical protein [Candidatus Acidoferrales bacterium]